MQRHQIVVAVVLSVETGDMDLVGDRAALDSDYVIRTLFEDLSAREVQKYLEDQILPRLVQQGRVSGVICMPAEDTVVGLYCHDERDVIQRYDTSKIIDAEIRELWASAAEAASP
jgi:hypothetical protein